MLRPTSIFQLVVLPYLANRYATVGPAACASMRGDNRQYGRHGLEEQTRLAKRPFCSSPRRAGRSRQKISYSTLEQATPDPTWVPPILDGVPWRGPPIPLQPPPHRFRTPLPPPTPDPESSEQARPSPLIRKTEPSAQPRDRSPSSTLSPELELSEEIGETPRVYEPDVGTSRTVQEILDSSRRQSFDPEHTDLKPLPTPARTAITAMRKIVDVHRSETERSKRAAVPLGHKFTSRPPIPPLVHKLLLQKEYRLAVFHVLSNPHIATSDRILENVAERLEAADQAELAHRLRSVPEDTRRFSINYEVSAPSLPFTPDEPPGFWDMTSTSVPPDPMRKYPPNWTDRQKVTHYLNAKLAYLNITPTLHRHTSSEPFLPPIEPSRSTQTFFRHGPGLQTLRDMLHTIDRYRRRWGFEPNRVTANIILKTWLACNAALPSTSYRRYTDSRGNHRITVKWPSSAPRLGGKDLMIIFRGVSQAMQDSVEAINLEVEKEPAEIDWETHVDPFARLFLRALYDADYKQGHKEVVRWNRMIKTYLGLVRDYRRLVREEVAEQRGSKNRTAPEGTRAESKRSYERVKRTLMEMRGARGASEGRWGSRTEDAEDSLMKLFPDPDRRGNDTT